MKKKALLAAVIMLTIASTAFVAYAGSVDSATSDRPHPSSIGLSWWWLCNMAT